MFKSGRGGSRPNSGRKPSPTGARAHMVNLRLSDTEYAIITQRALAAGLTVSEYIRRKALERSDSE
jgi:predicted DNA binding CopG/RHH family protein